MNTNILTIEIHEIIVPLIAYILVRGFLLLKIGNASHLDAFRWSCYLVVQEEMFSRSCCSNEQSAEHVTSRYNATSSVNNFRVEFLVTLCKLSVYNRNRGGPSTDPCGTPD